MIHCLGCESNNKELVYKNVFCSDCYYDRLINELDLYGIPIYILVSDTKIQVIIDDPNDLLGRVKQKISKKLMLQYSTPVSDLAKCCCGHLIKCEQSILVQVNGNNHAFCDLDCYENFRGKLYVKGNFSSR